MNNADEHDKIELNVGTVNSQAVSIGRESNASVKIEGSSISQATTQAKAEKLSELDRLVDQLKGQLSSDEASAVQEASAAVKREAKSPQPNRDAFSVSASGLVAAAKAVADLVGPISSVLEGLRRMIFGA